MGCKKIVEVIDGHSIKLTDPEDEDREPTLYAFDNVYDDDSTQEQVYNDLGRPILRTAFQGFNGTIFAYGQTGSGKTFSMMGAEGNLRGIIPRLNEELFQMMEEKKKEDDTLQFLITVSYLEIYNEVIKDLLNPSDKQLHIREHPKMGIYVQDLASLVVNDTQAVVELIEQGNSVRQVAATNMNARSSRSHSCFTIRVEQKSSTQHERDDGQRQETELKLNAKINLVDLAGSERAAKTGAEGKRLKEGAAINKSLSALGNVINALAEGSKHVRYRDSKLTRLLQESLGGNSLTVMVAAISPADNNYDESLSTVRYANRAKNIKNVAKRNEDVHEAIIRELRDEISELQRLLQEQQAQRAGGNQGTMSEEQVSELEEKIAALEHAKQQGWLKQQELSEMYEREREKNLKDKRRIMSVMDTIRDDNRELLKRLRQLMDDEADLSKRYKRLKEQHGGHRKELMDGMSRWQELYEEDGEREDGPHSEEMAEILDRVETLRETVSEEQAKLKDLKKEIKHNQDRQEEERAEAAAQRRMLEEDAELRKSIQEEERARLEQEAQTQLESRMEEERRRLRENAERERQELLAKYHASGAGGGPSDREQELEMELLELKRDKDILLLEMDQQKAQHDSELRTARLEAKRALREAKKRELAMFREMCDGIEEERRKMEERTQELSQLLQQATDDIKYLQGENQALRKQLVEATAWEPSL